MEKRISAGEGERREGGRKGGKEGRREEAAANLPSWVACASSS
jgi:hypothetical protein